MTVADAPQAPTTEQLTIRIEEGERGWFVARVEGTDAISQGHTPDEARANAISALAALTHRPRPLERVAWWLQARLDDLRQR
ncbi:MAG TPA: hypothetical protein VF257_15955 [Solirubrobacteraceae bacterium]